jgi:hypothetical protein
MPRCALLYPQPSTPHAIAAMTIQGAPPLSLVLLAVGRHRQVDNWRYGPSQGAAPGRMLRSSCREAALVHAGLGCRDPAVPGAARLAAVCGGSGGVQVGEVHWQPFRRVHHPHCGCYMLTWHMGCTWWRTHVRRSSCTLVLGPSAYSSLRDRCTLQLLASCGVATPCLPACLHPPDGASAACVGGTAVSSCRSMVKRRGMAMKYLLVNRRLRSMGPS